jgi:NAD(P)H-flavin reductase
VTLLPGDVTRIDLWQNGKFNWKPAQHVFLRFTDLAPLDNHPFTIASPPPLANVNQRHLVFLARSHTGFTQKLWSYVRNQSGQEDGVTTSVWLDGPYGGHSRPLHTRFDSLILVAGGTGITACLPWLLHTVSQAAKVNTKLKRVVLVWAMRTPDALTWLADEFDTLAGDKDKSAEVILRFHVTGTTSPRSTIRHSAEAEKTGATVTSTTEDFDSQIEIKGISSARSHDDHLTALGTRSFGRPVMAEVLREHARSGEKTVVFGCGPEGFRTDLGNAVAGAQVRVLRGECTEIAMHLETFGW